MEKGTSEAALRKAALMMGPDSIEGKCVDGFAAGSRNWSRPS
jgi:hypothetical protein